MRAGPARAKGEKKRSSHGSECRKRHVCPCWDKKIEKTQHTIRHQPRQWRKGHHPAQVVQKKWFNNYGPPVPLRARGPTRPTRPTRTGFKNGVMGHTGLGSGSKAGSSRNAHRRGQRQWGAKHEASRRHLNPARSIGWLVPCLCLKHPGPFPLPQSRGCPTPLPSRPPLESTRVWQQRCAKKSGGEKKRGPGIDVGRQGGPSLGDWSV